MDIILTYDGERLFGLRLFGFNRKYHEAYVSKINLYDSIYILDKLMNKDVELPYTVVKKRVELEKVYDKNVR